MGLFSQSGGRRGGPTWALTYVCVLQCVYSHVCLCSRAPAYVATSLCLAYVMMNPAVQTVTFCINVTVTVCQLKVRDGVNMNVDASVYVQNYAQDTAPWPGTYTSAGMHDEQLSAEEFLALPHVVLAARLEDMAEARGRPRPGQPHLDAEVENCDVQAGGDRGDSDSAFELDDALPGGEAKTEDQYVDMERDYLPQFAVMDEEMQDTVHRPVDAQKHMKSKQRTAKKELLQTFMAGHQRSYAAAQQPHAVHHCAPMLLKSSDQERRDASQQQQKLLEARKTQNQLLAQQSLHRSANAMASAQEARSRRLDEAELPPSPLDLSKELIATSGVWRSKEQYLATLFILQPIQQLWAQQSLHHSASAMASAQEA